VTQQQLVLSEEEVDKIRLLVQQDQRESARDQIKEELLDPMIDALLRIVQQNPDAARKGVKIEIMLQADRVDDRPTLTTAEVATRHRVSQQQVRRWCEQGLLPAVRTPGGTWRILQTQVLPLVPTHRKPKAVAKVAGRWVGRRDELAQHHHAADTGSDADR